jgi:hypothetical protein
MNNTGEAEFKIVKTIRFDNSGFGTMDISVSGSAQLKGRSLKVTGSKTFTNVDPKQYAPKSQYGALGNPKDTSLEIVTFSGYLSQITKRDLAESEKVPADVLTLVLKVDDRTNQFLHFHGVLGPVSPGESTNLFATVWLRDEDENQTLDSSGGTFRCSKSRQE